MAPPDPVETEVTWHGHSTSSIRMGGFEFLTDPVARSRVLHLRRHHPEPVLGEGGGERVILVSHLHFDHLDLPTLKSLGKEVPVVVSPGGGALLERKGFRNVTELKPDHTIAFGRTTVRAVEAAHGGARSPIHGRHQPVGYVLEGASTVYFAGDTDLFEGMEEAAAGADLALLPVWGWGPSIGPGHLDPERAAIAAGRIGTRFAVPIHWGTFLPFGLGRRLAPLLDRPAEEFERLARTHAPDTEVRVLRPGESVTYT